MKYGKDDYLIVDIDNKMYFGMAFSKGKLLQEDGYETDDQETIEFKTKQIVANLGKTPKLGKAFNVDTTIYIESLAVGWPIKLDIFREIDKKEKKIVIKSFKKSKEILDKHSADGWMSSLARLQLKPNRGKMQGCYKTKTSKSSGAQDILTLTSTDLKNEKEMILTLLHESSHGMWSRQVPRDIKAKWSSLFSKRAELNRFEQQDLEDLCDIIVDFVSTGMRFKDIESELKQNPEEQEVFKSVQQYVKRTHHIDKEELEALASAKPKKFKSLWPIVSDRNTFKADVTEYAMTNVKEFFAESMSYYLAGHKLPSDVTKGCKATLKGLVKFYE